ncbi:MAG TPA: hypothetical protein DCX53_02585 [Anaerolineae bacterium]|nr:hypothetical protein [Anaerolineae bacterium]
MDSLYEFGIGFIQSLQTNFSPALDGFMSTVSFLGRIEFYLVLIPFIYWTIDRRIGVRTLLILIYVDFVSSSFKLFFHQPRPYWLGGVKALSIEPSYGIPSSHASDSLAVGGFLGTRINKSWFWMFIGILIFLIGLSRLHLGVHFPHDVLFGWLIGFLVLWGFTKWQGAVRDWLHGKSLSMQIGLGFLDSLFIIILGLIIRLVVNGIPDPVSWSSFSVDARAITHFFTLAGAAFGTYAGYALMRHQARFDAKGTWSKRIIRYIVGIIGLLALYFGLDIIFATIAPDESTLGYILRYLRYGLATFWATFLAPWIFLKTRLADLEVLNQ